MRIVFSFFLALFLYSAIIYFFIYFLFFQNKVTKPKIVYVHQVISVEKIKKTKIKKIPQKKKIIESKKIEPKKEAKRIVKPKTKDKFSKGGEKIKFDDLFSNVDDNIPTTKVKQKKQENMTKSREESNLEKVKKELSTLQTTTQISNISGNQIDLKYIQNQFSKVWAEIDTNDGDFIRIKVDIYAGVLNVIVISTNLDTIRLNQFLSKIKIIDTSKIKNFSATIDFKSKLKD